MRIIWLNSILIFVSPLVSEHSIRKITMFRAYEDQDVGEDAPRSLALSGVKIDYPRALIYNL